jgi:Ca2+-transporting ATPase
VVETEHLVPGDVVLLEAGNLVPADLRLHEVRTVAGRRVGADRRVGGLSRRCIDPLPQGERPLGDRVNMAFKGTLVTHGRAAGLVIATGTLDTDRPGGAPCWRRR